MQKNYGRWAEGEKKGKTFITNGVKGLKIAYFGVKNLPAAPVYAGGKKLI